MPSLGNSFSTDQYANSYMNYTSRVMGVCSHYSNQQGGFLIHQEEILTDYDANKNHLNL